MIHQTYFVDDPKSSPPDFRKVFRHFSNDDITIWTEQAFIDFATEHFDKRIVDAFKKVKPKTFKSDLARHCLLYHFGGWYFDLKCLPSINLEQVASEWDLILFRDSELRTRDPYTLATSVIYSAKPGHRIFKDMIEQIVSNIENDFTGRDPHDVTGPTLFGKTVSKYASETHTLDRNMLVGDAALAVDDLSNYHIYFYTHNLANKSFSIISKKLDNNKFNSLVPKSYEKDSLYWKMHQDGNIY